MDPDFDDVERRPKHHHCRCPTCAKHEAVLQHRWQTRQDLTEIRSLISEHDQEVRNWRQTEADFQLRSRYSPESLVVLSYDDTCALGFPRFTNRPLKNMTPARVFVIPFNLTNHGADENFYFYTLKGMFKKGANRLCTTLWYVLRRLKTRPNINELDAQQKKAIHLVLLADNYSENKNMHLLAFCCELIHLEMFHKIELMYGPVGHTHNGNDAVHFVHNNIVGNFESVSPPEFFNQFYSSWQSDKTRPQPVIVDVQYNFKMRYKNHLRHIMFISRARAIQLSRGSNGIVNLMLKSSPRNEKWCGEGGIPDGPPFVILRSFPQDLPTVVPPSQLKMRPQDATALKGKSVRDYCALLGRSRQLEWTLDMMRLGHFPAGDKVTVERTAHRLLQGWQHVEQVGVETTTHVVPFVREMKGCSLKQFFGASSSSANVTSTSSSSSLAEPSPPLLTPPRNPLADVRYADEVRSQKRKSMTSTSNLDDDSEEDSESSGDDSNSKSAKVVTSTWETWAPFSSCRQGIFAVVKVEYEGSKGISVMKVIKLVPEREGFMGREYNPSSVYSSPSCIR
jgi:hypothetical protein